MGPAVQTMWEVVEEHLARAGSAWLHWARAMVAANHTVAEVAGVWEERLVANLEGLAVAGEETVERVLRPALGTDDIDRIAAASLALLASPGGPKEMVAALQVAAPEARGAMARALGLARGAGLEEGLGALLEGSEPAMQAAALDALAIRGRVPGSLRRFVASPDPEVKAAALRAARHAGLAHRAAIEAAMQSAVPEVRDAALEAGISLGLRAPWLASRKLAEARSPGCGAALSILAMSGEAGDLERIESALAVPELRGAALWALGFSGWPRAVELCLPYLGDGQHARVAGEAISAITGLAIEKQLVRAEEAPPEEPIPFEEEDLEADLVPGPEAALPLPEPWEVESWWQGERGRFQPAVRYLGGEAVSPSVLLTALGNGSMRRRGPIALELAARSHGEYWVETRTWAREQMAAMAGLRLEARSGFCGGFGRRLQG